MAGIPVTIFLPSLAGGGAERCLVTVANGLARRGAVVTLALGTVSGPYRDEVNADVRVLDFRAASAPRALPGLVRHLRSSSPTVVLSAMSHANVVAALAHRLAGCRARLVLSERSHLTSSLEEYRGLRMRVTRMLMATTYSWADQIVAVSNSVAEDLVRQVPSARDRVVTIYNPIVNKRLYALSRATPKHPWLSDTVPVVLAAGRLIRLKDFATLIDAFSRLRRKRPLRLLILGEGNQREPLLAQAARLGISGDVALPGFDTNPFSAMRAARVFVQSSRYEGLPGALVQAMACGARIVSTDCPGGTREVLENGRWGALVPIGDAGAMAAAIAAQLDDPTPSDVCTRAAVFGEEQAIDRYAEVLGLPRDASRNV